VETALKGRVLQSCELERVTITGTELSNVFANADRDRYAVNSPAAFHSLSPWRNSTRVLMGFLPGRRYMVLAFSSRRLGTR